MGLELGGEFWNDWDWCLALTALWVGCDPNSRSSARLATRPHYNSPRTSRGVRLDVLSSDESGLTNRRLQPGKAQMLPDSKRRRFTSVLLIFRPTAILLIAPHLTHAETALPVRYYYAGRFRGPRLEHTQG